MVNIGIVGNGPRNLVPDLSHYKDKIDIWIGADRGALVISEHHIKIDYAVGDFDSMNETENDYIKKMAQNYIKYPVEKNHTDIEIALMKAFELSASKIQLFGVTGGRLDHGLINIQLLYTIQSKNIAGIIIDKYNQLEMTFPGKHLIKFNRDYPNISFVPYTKDVKGLTLSGFYYPLNDAHISWGSTRCISNELLSNKGNFYYEEGILLLIKSRDIMD